MPNWAGKPLDRALLTALAELAGEGVILDAGAGPGHVGAFLTAAARVVAVDLSTVMCGLALASGVPAAAGDLAALPVRSGCLAGIVCFYAVIHLDAVGRTAAYREFARVLRPGGHVLMAFHVRDLDVAAGESRAFDEWFDQPVDLLFHYLDPEVESASLAAAGLAMVARLDRRPDGSEHASDRCYLLFRRP